MYTLSTNMYLLGNKMDPLGANMYLLKSEPVTAFVPLFPRV